MKPDPITLVPFTIEENGVRLVDALSLKDFAKGDTKAVQDAVLAVLDMDRFGAAARERFDNHVTRINAPPPEDPPAEYEVTAEDGAVLPV
jgi:hypothetical protein